MARKTFAAGQAVMVCGIGRVSWVPARYVRLGSRRHLVEDYKGNRRLVPDGRIKTDPDVSSEKGTP